MTQAQDVAVRPQTKQVVPADADSIMAVISRAAADPATDVGKLERLTALYERIVANTARAAYTEALAAMQPELPVIIERGGIRDRAGNVQSKYALWEDINEAIKPILAKHGFALSFRTGYEGDKIVVTGVLSHRSGHSEDTTMHLPVDTSGSKNAVQAVGSSTSYGKRYTAQALLNLTSRGEDDDGKAAAGIGDLITDEQAETLRETIVDTAADLPRFLGYFRIVKLGDLKAVDYPRALDALKKKGAKK